MTTELEKVQSREQFAVFVSGLLKELQERPEEWENRSLEDFLEALAAYATDVPGYLKNVRSPIDPAKPSWELFALIVAGAAIYE